MAMLRRTRTRQRQEAMPFVAYAIFAGCCWWIRKQLSYLYGNLPSMPSSLQQTVERNLTSIIHLAVDSGKKEIHPSLVRITKDFESDLSRAFDWIPFLPCEEPESNWYRHKIQRKPATTGLLFVKPYKAASSSAVTIHLRLAKHLAQDRNRRQEFESQSIDICKVRYDHVTAYRMKYGKRERPTSFLWSIVRDPTKRAVSQYYHFHVGRNNVSDTDANFKYALSRENSAALTNYYFRILSFSDRPMNAIDHTQGILSGYDFLALTERFDESMVVLSMLTNKSLASFLYLPSKKAGGYDDGGGKEICTYIPPSRITPERNAFLNSDLWHSKIYWDQVFHQAVNRSLDRTIDETIGRSNFEQQLQRYKSALKVAFERCAEQTVFPCDEFGVYHKRNDCLWTDSGCGHECLDEVATELGL